MFPTRTTASALSSSFLYFQETTKVNQRSTETQKEQTNPYSDFIQSLDGAEASNDN